MQICFFTMLPITIISVLTSLSLLLVDFLQCLPLIGCRKILHKCTCPRWLLVWYFRTTGGFLEVFQWSKSPLQSIWRGLLDGFLGLVFTVSCKKFKRKYHNRNFENYHRVFKKYSFNFSLYPKRKFHHSTAPYSTYKINGLRWLNKVSYCILFYTKYT